MRISNIDNFWLFPSLPRELAGTVGAVHANVNSRCGDVRVACLLI